MNRKNLSTTLRQYWWLIVILAALLIGYLVWKNTSSDTNTTSMDNTALVAQPADTTPSDDGALNENKLSNNELLGENADLSDASASQTFDPKSILEAPLPETDSLAKEEIDRLEDERQRMAEQDKLVAEQLAMNEKLSKMKAEQIALLEQQIAELEADKTAVE